jgi:formylglycine-generating enzyme required for sulfatase activity
MNKRDCTLGAALCAAQLFAASGALANNIQVSSVTLQNIDTANDTAMVQFNLSWENSWRVANAPGNYDAAWVFVKFHTGDLIWRTATLDALDSAHSVPAAATLDMGLNGTRGLGAFIYRSGTGTGNNAFNNIRLKWNYGADLVSDAALVTLDVHAVEMVYVPEGAFFVGDGVARSGAADIASLVAGATPAGSAPFQIANAGPTPVGPAAGSLSHTGQGAGTYKAVPTTFPNGFSAFYLMKYEASQGQWAAFLNATSKLPGLTYIHYEVLGPIVPATNPPRDFLAGRQVFSSPDLPPPTMIPGPIPPNPVPPTPTRPMVRSHTPDRAFLATEITALAYLDWSGLRPMTEFELEKAARGPVTPVAGEFAWGTADIGLLPYGAPGGGGATALSADGLPNEAPAVNYNEAGGNAWVRPTQLTLPLSGSPAAPILGPARVGMFARASYNPPTPPRIQSGAGYYGIMDLTGNVSELVAKWTFQVGTSTVALFTSEHGDGELGPNGQHNVPGWFTTVPPAATFFGLRGGSFADQPAPISQRSLITGGTLTNVGIRGARSAPVATP